MDLNKRELETKEKISVVEDKQDIVELLSTTLKKRILGLYLLIRGKRH